MLGEAIKRNVLNRKVIITILLVCFAGVVDVLHNESFIIFHNESFIYVKGAVILIMGVVFTAIIVPLMYCITIHVKNIITCAIVNGLARGMLGAYLIMLLTIAATVIIDDFIFDTIDFDLGLEYFFMIIAYAAIILPLLMCVPPVITDADPTSTYFIFTLCTIASFVIAEFVERRFRG